MREGYTQKGYLQGEPVYGMHFHYDGSLSVKKAAEVLKQKGIINKDDDVLVLMNGESGTGGHKGSHIAVIDAMVDPDEAMDALLHL